MNGYRPANAGIHAGIVGGGFSGTLLAINLLRHPGARATLIERRAHLARGLAYSTAHPSHLLNVRAANMSAFPDDPGHFERWIARSRPDLQGAFIPRTTYGDYLQELLTEASSAAMGRLDIVRAEVVDIEKGGSSYRMILENGSALAADAVALAPGNLPPHDPPGIGELAGDPDRYAADPWAHDIADGLEEDDVILVIGTGLTMVDVVLLLDARGFRGRIIALSRRGLVNHAHAGISGIIEATTERPRETPAGLLRVARAQARAGDWRAVVDGLRPWTQDIWSSASFAEQARFLRHLRPWWDIHRHRLAPEIAWRIDKLRADGRLHIRAAKDIGFTPKGAGVEVHWRCRGTERSEGIVARRIVNCTGPQGDLLRARDPLLRRLLERGMIRADVHRLGIEVNQQAQVIDSNGNADPGLMAIGPMTRGAFWEIVAVPDIRIQTWNVAHRISQGQSADKVEIGDPQANLDCRLIS